MGEALLWGIIAGSSLVLGGVIAAEALHHGGKLAGFVTTVGFALAFAISSTQ